MGRAAPKHSLAEAPQELQQLTLKDQLAVPIINMLCDCLVQANGSLHIEAQLTVHHDVAAKKTCGMLMLTL